MMLCAFWQYLVIAQINEEQLIGMSVFKHSLLNVSISSTEYLMCYNKPVIHTQHKRGNFVTMENKVCIDESKRPLRTLASSR